MINDKVKLKNENKIHYHIDVARHEHTTDGAT